MCKKIKVQTSSHFLSKIVAWCRVRNILQEAGESVKETKKLKVNCGRFARRRSPGLKSIRPMTYNTLQHGEHTDRKCYFSKSWISHVQSLSFHAYSFFSGLKNDKYTLGEST